MTRPVPTTFSLIYATTEKQMIYIEYLNVVSLPLVKFTCVSVRFLSIFSGSHHVFCFISMKFISMARIEFEKKNKHGLSMAKIDLTKNKHG